MAQPPEVNETFLREVDENLRRDQARDFARKNGKWVLLAVVLFLAATGGYIWWQQHQRERSEQQTEVLADIYRNVSSGKAAAATKPLGELSQSGSKAIRASAEFTSAAVALQSDDSKGALEKYRAIAADTSLPQPYRDAALIRQTALEFDRLKPAEIVARLEPLAKPGEPWFGTAGEMTGLALVKQGRKAQAGELFAAIAKDKTVPQSARERALQLAGSFGVDASSALPAQ